MRPSKTIAESSQKQPKNPSSNDQVENSISAISDPELQISELLFLETHFQRYLRFLVEAAASEVVCDDDVGDGVEHELNVLCVGGAGHVAVDLLRRRLVFGFELGLDVGGRLAVFLKKSDKMFSIELRHQKWPP